VGLAAAAGLRLVLVGAAIAAELLVIELGVGATCSGAPVRVIGGRCTRPSCSRWPPGRAVGLAAAAGLRLVLVGAAIAAEPLVIELGVGGHRVELLASRQPLACTWCWWAR